MSKDQRQSLPDKGLLTATWTAFSVTLLLTACSLTNGFDDYDFTDEDAGVSAPMSVTAAVAGAGGSGAAGTGAAGSGGCEPAVWGVSRWDQACWQ